ncbi:MAG: phenylacetate-CoA oxygenase subunit PaaJ [Burkholderiales bacterium]|nr:phenylacetate-CoA oxygenase subunit PaaJ [Burkholderiales bacterium]
MVTPFSALPEPLFPLVPSADDARIAQAWALLDGVADPEIPVVSVCELGIIRAVRVDGARVEVDVTPTYAGCPATEVIAADIRAALAADGFAEATVRMVLSPPWTTDAITEAGRAKLQAYGIAPPGPLPVGAPRPVRFAQRQVACPQCGSLDTERLAEFGSTACKALFRCRACREPFDYFKPL